ncbi:hypothetical protein Undi14_10600 [Undibacterium sp. 14-3-2]|uniref:hypothetical protein n=1 Tax=Undibacterium sp. 14-3-2 TaxID=2800129 RepID=UPI001906447A|nr:hypothetical protein [Undibacterium sp. 14-3-2]MBK1890487.1 hypothetical protein [Undibacterium sp. 14-3-2]
MIRPIIYLLIATIAFIDFMCASVGVPSFAALTHLELTAGIEFLITIVLAVMAFSNLIKVNTNGSHITVLVVSWFVVLGLLIKIAAHAGDEITQHWDNQILHLVNESHADDINEVEWSSDVPAHRKKCTIVKKENIRLFNMFKYRVACVQPDIFLSVVLSINTLEGKAGAYIKLER